MIANDSNLQKEFGAGYTSGFQHDPNDPLCQANIRKIETGVNSTEPLVKSYWLGYQSALRDRNTLDKDLRAKAEKWYRSLSMNEQKDFCKAHKAVVIDGWTLPSYLVEMFLAAK